MKTKHKIIIAAVIAAVICAIAFFFGSIKLSIVYTDKNGKPTNEGELGKFRLTFAGSEHYSSKELEQYFFKDESERHLVKFIYNQKFGDKISIPFVETYDLEILSPTDYKITIYEKSIVGYVEYMGSNMYFDKDGIVVESSTEKLKNVPLITGIEFDYIVLHKNLPVENEKIFTVLLDVTQCIEKYGVKTKKINIDEELNIEITIGKVRVDLGTDKDLNEKIRDLADIVPTLVDEKGVLNMSVYNANGTGYTFKKDSEKTTEEDKTNEDETTGDNPGGNQNTGDWNNQGGNQNTGDWNNQGGDQNTGDWNNQGGNQNTGDWNNQGGDQNTGDWNNQGGDQNTGDWNNHDGDNVNNN